MRRPPTRTELGLDSLTDTMTNMLGMILMMVVGTVLMTRGTRLQLPGVLTEPGKRTPIYLVCKNNRILAMHRGGGWSRELEPLCEELKATLKRTPTTSETLLEANRRRLCDNEDFRAVFVRETIQEAGQAMYVIGVRFLPRAELGPPPKAPVFTPASLRVLEQADREKEYIDAFVYEGDFEAVVALQQRAQRRKIQFGWRPLLEHQIPGLSEIGTPGAVGGGK